MPIPKRNTLHQACIHNQLEFVKATLITTPSRIEEQDPLGFTPLMLAAANGHVELVQWLIGHSASLDTKEFKLLSGEVIHLRLIEQVKTPAIMELILYHGVDPHEFKERLIRAVTENDQVMFECMLYYLNKLPNDRGFSTLELVMQHSIKRGTVILDTLLSYYDDYVIAPPYDTQIREMLLEKTNGDTSYLIGPFAENIPQAVADKLAAHNVKIAKREQERRDRPHIVTGSLRVENDCIFETLRSEKYEIISAIKPIKLLTSNEKTAIVDIFFANFEMYEHDTKTNRDNYIKYALADNPKKDVYVNLFTHNGKIISFITFELETARHPTVGSFILFHGKLAGNLPQYSSLGLTNMAYRIPLVLKELNPEMKLFSFMKAIPPGSGLCLLPKTIRFFPKHILPQALMNFIVSLTDEKLEGNVIRVKLKVKEPRASNRDDKFALRYYSHIVGPGTEFAAAVCYEMDPRTITEYLHEFSFNGVTVINLEQLADAWKNLTNMKEYESQPFMQAKL